MISTERLKELESYLRSEAESELKEARWRDSTAEAERNATAEELRAAKRMAETMSGRKLDLVSATVASARDSARMHSSIAGKCRTNAGTLTSYADTVQEMASELLALREAERWRAVETELPEVGGTYLVRARFGKPFAETTNFGVLIYFDDGPMWSLTGKWPDQKHVVTHWRPLPQPPAEEGEQQ